MTIGIIGSGAIGEAIVSGYLLLVPRNRHAGVVAAYPVLRDEQTCRERCYRTDFDAVDGARSAASRCHRVVALEQTTLRGAVHG